MDLGLLCVLIFALTLFPALGLAVYNSGQRTPHGRSYYRRSMIALMQMGMMSMLFKAQLDLKSLTFATHPWTILYFLVFLFLLAIYIVFCFRADRESNTFFHSALNMLELAYPDLSQKEHQERANTIADHFDKGRHDIVDEFMRDITVALNQRAELRRQGSPAVAQRTRGGNDVSNCFISTFYIDSLACGFATATDFLPPANAQRLNMASFSSNELNYLVWRYLQESGFSHTAFLFRQECNLSESEIDSSGIAVGALPNIVQKGIYYVGAELSSAATDDMGKAMEDRLSLLEAVNEKPVVQLRTPQEPSSSQTQNNSDMSPKDAQRERDRDALANSHNGVTKRDRQISPRSNGILGVHSKKQHAAQQAQASSVTNGAAEKDNAKDDLENIKFPKESIRLLKCRNSPVFSCAWNPKIDLMASGSGDSTTRLWDLTGSENPSTSDRKFESSTLILEHSALDGEQGKDPPTNKDVTSLDWHHTGELLATGYYDGIVRLWSRDGPLVCTLKIHEGPIFALKWSNNGNYILSAGADRKVSIVWDRKNGKPQQQQFCFHLASALDVDWISDDMFASCSEDKTIHVCQLSQPEQPYRKYNGHGGEVNAVKYDKHSGRLASCSDDTTLRIWSLEDESPVHVWKAHQKEIETIRWSPQGHILASASDDHTVRVWDVRRGEAVRSLTRHSDPVRSVSFSPDGRLLASGCLGRSVFIWDIHNGKLVQSYVGDKNLDAILDISWNFNGDKVAASANDGTVILMDVRHLKNKLV